jgi:hypothetical protein
MRTMTDSVRNTIALLLLVAGCGTDQGTGLLALSISADGSIPAAAASSVVLSLQGTKSRTWTGAFPRADGEALLIEYPNLPASDSPVAITVQAFDGRSCLVGTASKQVTVRAGVITSDGIVLGRATAVCGDGGFPTSIDAQPSEAGGRGDTPDMSLDGTRGGNIEAGVLDVAAFLDSSMIDGTSDTPRFAPPDGVAGSDASDSAQAVLAEVRAGGEVAMDTPLGTGGILGSGGAGGVGSGGTSGGGGLGGSGGVASSGGVPGSGSGGLGGSGGVASSGGDPGTGSGGVYGSGGVASSGGIPGSGGGGITGAGGGSGGATGTGGNVPGTGGSPGTHTETATSTSSATSTSTTTSTSTNAWTATASQTATTTSTSTAVGSGTDDWTGLGAYYKLEAPEGTNYPDETTNHYTATAYGVTTAAGAIAGSNFSAHMDTYVTGGGNIATPYHSPSEAAAHAGGSALSVWVRPLIGAEVLHGTPGNVLWSATTMNIGVSGGVATILCNDILTTTMAGDLNQWYHIICSYDGSNWALYVNGTQRATSGMVYINGGSVLRIGNPYFSEDIDEVRAYNRGLSATEAQNLYACNKTNCTSTFATTDTVTTTNTTSTTETSTRTVTDTVTVTNTNTSTTTVTITVPDTSP